MGLAGPHGGDCRRSEYGGVPLVVLRRLDYALAATKPQVLSQPDRQEKAGGLASPVSAP